MAGRARNWGLAVGAVLVVLGAAEVTVRVLVPRPAFGDVPLYVAHPSLVYTGNPKARMWHNREGFGDRNHTLAKPAGVIRIACLGGSTTYGKGNWPGRLAVMLKEGRGGERFEVLNFGMAGYTTAESLANLVEKVQGYSPDYLVIHHAMNDVMPRLYEKMESDYGHFRKPFEAPGAASSFLARQSALYAWLSYRLGAGFSLAGATMRLDGDDPDNPFRPDYLNPDAGVFRGNLQQLISISRAEGIRPILTTMPHSNDPAKLPRDWAIDFEIKNVAMSDHNGIIRELAADDDVPLVDLDRDMSGQEAYFVDHVHCNADGRNEKARRVAKRLLAEVGSSESGD